MAGALINVPANVKRGETFEIKTLVRHPMETGYRRGPSGEAIARDIIHRFVCTYDGEEIFRAELFPAVAGLGLRRTRAASSPSPGRTTRDTAKPRR